MRTSEKCFRNQKFTKMLLRPGLDPPGSRSESLPKTPSRPGRETPLPLIHIVVDAFGDSISSVFGSSAPRQAAPLLIVKSRSLCPPYRHTLSMKVNPHTAPRRHSDSKALIRRVFNALNNEPSV